jgi:excisionase family DNA binding protein
MFYSIQETAEKLGVTEDDVKQLARDGKLREFRDGENIMFKVEEVDKIHNRESSLKFDVLDEAPVEPEDVTTEDDGDMVLETPAPDIEEPLPLQEETADIAEASADDLDALLAFTDDDEIGEEATPAEVAPTAEAEESAAIDADLDLLSMDDVDLSEDELQIDLLSDTQIVSEEPTPAAADESASDLDDILMSDAEVPSSEPETSMEMVDDLNDDTAITSEGINVLGETDGDYKLTDDTMAETLAGLGATGEASLEEIEEDVNLDSFGSGSGLLDLSLQADDTSLGGILDEIYTSDDDDAPAPDTEHATTEAMAAEVDHIPSADDMSEPEMAMVPIRSGSAIAEIEPDASSNVLGALLFVPLILAIYTAIVSLYATVTEGQLVGAAAAVKGFFWIIMGALFVIALVWAIVGFAKGSSGSAKPKAKKAKQAKAEKPKKAKKEKKPKEKKAKKGLFGKKK